MAESNLELTGTATVHITADVEVGVTFGKNVRVWRWSHIMPGAVLGDWVKIGEHVHIGPNVKIGNGVKIQNGAQIFEGVVIEDDVYIGPGACFTNIRKPRSSRPNNKFLQTIVKKGASIGANATIVCGVTIGENAMVGAGCVVNKDIPPNVTVVGNPARVVRQPKVFL
jgi:UDP-2-acetamido-3-amino-2,3-dideoxy-glucuronate N-acetyltransferase